MASDLAVGAKRPTGETYVIIFIAALLVTVAVTAALSLGPLGRSATWAAVVTPLASIIGSGFLICGPILAHEFGGAAALGMALLLALAYALGEVLRFNIRAVEPILEATSFHRPIAWWARIGQALLSAAYAISVAYYLKLLAEFVLKFAPMGATQHALLSKILVTAVIALLVGLSAFGGLRRIQHLAHMTVSLKIGVIAGMLAALALYWLLRWNTTVILPPARMSFASLGLLLGLLVTVQGFETSRYLGHAYDADLRIRSMRYAQWLSSAIYMGFLLLLTPFLGPTSRATGVAGVLDVMDLAAPFMSILVLVGALASQLSAAIADSIGSAGLASEVSRRRLGVRGGFFASAALAVAVVWLTDPFQVVAVASRTFALYYAVQCLLAFIAAPPAGGARLRARAMFAVLGGICVVAAVAGAPAE
jgi:hypothetical protein